MAARRRRDKATSGATRDLSNGAIVVLSGGFVDGMNPPDVLDRMDEFIADVNADPYVEAHTHGKGLRFKLLRGQTKPHIHQSQWRDVARVLEQLQPSPLILVGHSYGGAAAVSVARALASGGTAVDLLCTHDSVQTIDDLGDPNRVPPNVSLNLNPYVIPTPAWMLAPFPIGRRNSRDTRRALDAVLNIGLTYNLGGAFSHKNAFFELAGGDRIPGAGFALPHLLLDVTLAVLRGAATEDVLAMVQVPLQTLATKSRIVVELETKDFKKTLTPDAITLSATAVALTVVTANVREALDALPATGANQRYAGPVESDGMGKSHVQGVAASGHYLLITHSDMSRDAGRIIVVDRRPDQRKFVTEWRLPSMGTAGKPLNHAGGCQILGNVLVVPSESGGNTSVVAFFDVTDPLKPRELNPSLRIIRPDRDAAAAGITATVRNGQLVWVCAVYDSGSVDFYESPDLLGGAPFRRLLTKPIKVDEKHHQALLLVTDQANQLFAIGLNRGNVPYFNDLVLYMVDIDAESMAPDPKRSYKTTKGARLRWGAGLEVVGEGVVLHCTDRNYEDTCDVNTFAPARRMGKRVVRRPEGRPGRRAKAQPSEKAATNASARGKK